MRAGARSASFFAALWALAALACTTTACAPRTGPQAAHRDTPCATPGSGRSLLEGACVGVRDLDAYCGDPGSGSPATGNCIAPVCAAGEASDLAAASCVPVRAVHAMVARDRAIPDDAAIGCHEGSTLVVRAGHVACLPHADACPRATRWDPAVARCIPMPACPPGEIRASPCVRVVSRSPAGAPLVDVGRWMRAMIGADGGDGSDRLCRPLLQQPWAFDVGAGGARTIALAVELVFPDNDVAGLSARVQPLDPATGVPFPLPGDAARAATAAVESLLVPLRALGEGGGVADAASATVRVTCALRGGSSPVVLPRGTKAGAKTPGLMVGFDPGIDLEARARVTWIVIWPTRWKD